MPSIPMNMFLIVDDLIATGGTVEAAIRLVKALGGEVVGASFIINLPDLSGAQKVRDHGVPVLALAAFEGIRPVRPRF